MNTWDVVVIGGGPSGMMAAGRAAELGKKVLLLEKNESLGKKLLITGGGRCNVTNGELDTRTLLKKFKENDKFLFSAFSKWSVQETLSFFHSRNMPTKVENEKRVFPVSNSSVSVLNVLLEYIKEGNVTVQSNAPVKKIYTDGNVITHVELKGGEIIKASSFVLATGGTSHPETGSTGDGFVWLKELGHTVTEPTASLVPVALDVPWLVTLQGVTLTDAKISVLQNNTKQAMYVGESKRQKPKLVHSGKVLFTHFGISGPTILNMSKDIGELVKYGDTYISLDILPTLDHGTLNKKLNDLFRTESNKKLKNCFGMIDENIPKALMQIIIEKSNINPDTFAHSVTREDRLKLIDTCKNFTMKVKGLLGKDKAIVSSGGVPPVEVDFKTMKSRQFNNLYLIGDVLDIDRPSGGYSLQLCWTTGFVAGDDIGNQ